MDFSTSDKTTILIHLFDYQAREIQRREAREQQMFEWTVGLLLAAFGAIVALSDRDAPLLYPVPVKMLATVLIGVPTIIFAVRIRRYTERSVENAEAIDRIERVLHLFEEGYYGVDTPYPEEWAGGLSNRRKKRNTQNYYSAIMLLLAVCVIATVWLIL